MGGNRRNNNVTIHKSFCLLFREFCAETPDPKVEMYVDRGKRRRSSSKIGCSASSKLLKKYWNFLYKESRSKIAFHGFDINERDSVSYMRIVNRTLEALYVRSIPTYHPLCVFFVQLLSEPQMLGINDKTLYRYEDTQFRHPISQYNNKPQLQESLSVSDPRHFAYTRILASISYFHRKEKVETNYIEDLQDNFYLRDCTQYLKTRVSPLVPNISSDSKIERKNVIKTLCFLVLLSHKCKSPNLSYHEVILLVNQWMNENSTRSVEIERCKRLLDEELLSCSTPSTDFDFNNSVDGNEWSTDYGEDYDEGVRSHTENVSTFSVQSSVAKEKKNINYVKDQIKLSDRLRITSDIKEDENDIVPSVLLPHRNRKEVNDRNLYTNVNSIAVSNRRDTSRKLNLCLVSVEVNLQTIEEKIVLFILYTIKTIYFTYTPRREDYTSRVLERSHLFDFRRGIYYPKDGPEYRKYIRKSNSIGYSALLSIIEKSCDFLNFINHRRVQSFEENAVIMTMINSFITKQRFTFLNLLFFFGELKVKLAKEISHSISKSQTSNLETNKSVNGNDTNTEGESANRINTVLDLKRVSSLNYIKNEINSFYNSIANVRNGLECVRLESVNRLITIRSRKHRRSGLSLNPFSYGVPFIINFFFSRFIFNLECYLRAFCSHDDVSRLSLNPEIHFKILTSSYMIIETFLKEIYPSTFFSIVRVERIGYGMKKEVPFSEGNMVKRNMDINQLFDNFIHSISSFHHLLEFLGCTIYPLMGSRR